MQISDPDVKNIWATVEEQRFLQDIGFYALNTNLHIRNESHYLQLQDATQKFVAALLCLYKKDNGYEAFNASSQVQLSPTISNSHGK